MKPEPLFSRRQLIGGLAGLGGALAMPALARATSLEQALDGLDVRIVKPGDDDAWLFNISYNIETTLVPEVRALPRTPEAALQLFRWIRDNDRSFAIRSSGHSFIGLSQNTDIVVDLREFNQVDYDRSAGHVVAQSGATMRAVHEKIGPLDLVIAGGTFYGVALGGVATGGGVGYFARRSGLLCDQIAAIDWIDADGRLRQCSAEEDADLFWAFCGGGAGSFGFVTGFALRALAPGVVHSIDIVEALSPEQALGVALYWLVWSELAPAHTTTHLTLQPYGPGKILVVIRGIAGGERQSLMDVLQDVLQSDQPVLPSRVQTGRISEIKEFILPGYDKGNVHLASRSHLFEKPIAAEAIAALINVLLRYPNQPISANFELLGGAVADIAPAGTAFVHRLARSLVHLQGRAAAPQETGDPVHQAVAELVETLTPYATDGIYMNYPEADRENWADAYWGSNLPRLKQIKAKYDPDNIFHHAQSVPLP